MSHKILKVGFNLLRENIRTHNLGDDFMIFDNFSGDKENHVLMEPTDFPINLKDITMIVFCTEGSIGFNLGLKSLTLSRNQLCMVLPGQIFQTTEVSGDFRAGCMVMKKDFFNFRNDIAETIILHQNLADRHFFNLREKEMSEYLTIYGQIKSRIIEPENDFHREIVQCYCQIMFYNIYGLMKNIREETAARQKKGTHYLYEKFMRLVEQNYKTEFRLSFYADRLCLTPKYLSSVIYNITGKHAAEWINEYRMLEAKVALRTTSMSLKDIAEMLNFSTPSHFGRFFKHYAGLTPHEYRKLSF